MPDSAIRVLVVYHHLPHYRQDVFRRLEDDPRLSVAFAAALRSRDGVAVIDPATLQHVHPLRNRWCGPLLWQVGLLPLIGRRRPDVVVFLGVCTYLSSWAGSLLARALGAEVLHWTIGWHRPEHGWRRLFRLTFYRLASRLLLYGHLARDIGVAMGYPAERMTVVYNSASAPTATARTAELLAAYAARLPDPETTVVGAVIRLNPVKRLDLLIRAVARLRADGRPVEVLLVGDGPDRAALTTLAADLGVPLWLPGAAYAEAELDLAYARIRVTVVPSAAGLTVLQSFRYGRPVITHDRMEEQMPECEAITAGQTGAFYAHGDEVSLRDALAEWLDRQRDDPEGTARACRRALDTTWNAQTSARLIGDQIAQVATMTRGVRGRSRRSVR